MYRVVKFNEEDKYINDFLKLPKLIYSKKEMVQNESEERALLLSKHILSKYFVLHKFLVYKNSEVAARCVITIYEGDSSAYIGFFECIEDSLCAEKLFSEVKAFTIKNNYKKIVGPVDASFWLKYRMKVNKFEKRPYVSEPYNKNYYLDLFLQNKYKICENYVSNMYEKFTPKNFQDEKIEKRYENFINKGYKITSPKKEDYDKVIHEIYRLITNLYSDFPIFKPLKEEDFVSLFKSYKYILDFSMVKLVCFKKETVGFFICLPDYKNFLYGKINLITLFRVFLNKRKSKNYVMLYVGVQRGHLGLGNAMIKPVVEKLKKRRATAIGAFIREGKVTESYVKKKIQSKYRYVLLELEL
ncbi:hypothetical protein [Clostridium felsineum]|uniref:hypothetical protein n=1 Tax=Clostridium felsineum TaxID=36839 RepID=UPI00098C0716|nr:hypothetical protein [Clostridium felsineum]URZ17445.1 hypothetical protein CLFE_034980 [Clostridium felsineum DSM 794]